MSHNYDKIIVRALELGQKRRPSAPSQHHSAFASCVAYAVTGWTGGSGPSMRAHWATKLVLQAGTPGKISFETADKIVWDACYGPVTLKIAEQSALYDCFDDAPGELDLARKLRTSQISYN